MQIKFEILKKGDTVLNVWENHIAVKKKSGEVEIFQSWMRKVSQDFLIIQFW